MAAAVICECCGVTVKHTEAKHIRIHKMTSATEYLVTPIETSDVCNECFNTIRRIIKQGDKDK